MTKKTIFLIEQDPSVAKLYQRVFELKGYNLLTAYRQEDIVDLLTKHQPDFLLVDEMVNNLTTGIGLLQKVYKKTKIKKIPCIFLYDLDPKEAEAAKALRVKESFDKLDFIPNQIVAKVKQYLND